MDWEEKWSPTAERQRDGLYPAMGGKGAKGSPSDLAEEKWSPTAERQRDGLYPAMGGKGAKGSPSDLAWGALGNDEAWDDSKPRKVTRTCKDNLVPTGVLLRRAGISRAHLYVLLNEGRAPQPIKLGRGRRGAVRYVEAEVDAWVASLIASRTSRKPDLFEDEAGRA